MLSIVYIMKVHLHVYRIYSIKHTVRLVFCKIAPKMLDEIAFQLSHSENESCHLQTAVMEVFTFCGLVMSDAILGTANCLDKCKMN